jgi:hypothetical protein
MYFKEFICSDVKGPQSGGADVGVLQLYGTSIADFDVTVHKLVK